MKSISKTVWLLSLISLFTDTASEMLYPIMPIYLKSIGFSVFIIGILEGIAEATAGLSKGYFGNLSDITGKRVPFVQIGYALSAISKPLMAIFIHPVGILFARTMDRLGKGIRTGARDALLSSEASHSNKGKIFGFHRSMDTIGAVIGPVIALSYLYFFPDDYKALFFIAFIPGLLAILISFLLKENVQHIHSNTKITFLSFVNYWKKSNNNYKRLTIGLLLFALINSSDVFLLLKAKSIGLNDRQVLITYIFYNLTYALFAFPLGIIADKLGLKNVFIFGLTLFAFVYFGMAIIDHKTLLYFLFFIYGIYAAATEGIAKAWISNIVLKSETATAIGTYSAFQSICTMIASATTGYLWYKYSATFAFLFISVVTLILCMYFIFVPYSAQAQIQTKNN